MKSCIYFYCIVMFIKVVNNNNKMKNVTDRQIHDIKYT